MSMIAAFIFIVLLSITLVLLASVPWKGRIAIAAVFMLGILSGIIACRSLTGIYFEYLFPGSIVTGEVPVRVDALSAFFILIINFTFLTGAIYGLSYLKAYWAQAHNLALHSISFILCHASLISICVLQNSIAFLTAWEIMALSSFMLIIFEHNKRETLDAGINFLIQSHIGIMLLTLGFIGVGLKMNTYDFKAITLFTSFNPMLIGLALFMCFFTGFAIKAGFVPFHTWLPYAHPVAPAHISGVMSGVIIKIGIYGILRMVLLIKTDYLVVGSIILFVSVVSGIYGVMLAIIQHNLKRLLAYHSIENIGIIGMGIGLGCIGMGKANNILIFLGFAGALLHTLNHSLFKSLLFYGSGNVNQAVHSMDIEKMGGLGKLMPHTSLLFLVAAIAICGLSPFNGFVSEFMIYNGMFTGLHGSDKAMASFIVCCLFGLALIGGLAILCFTKAVGSVFLGSARHPFHSVPVEAGAGKLFPMYAIAFFIICIGLSPKIFITALSAPLALFAVTTVVKAAGDIKPVTDSFSMIGAGAAGLIILTGLIFFVRSRITLNKPTVLNDTWGCGYIAPSGKMQYSASSFIRSYRKLAEPVLSIRKKKKEIGEIFPKTGGQETKPYDKTEEWLIDYPLQLLKKFLNRFAFLQNGNLQFYILYGVVFISLILGFPLAWEHIKSLIHFLNKL
jgi:hydrogenase-4 component B